MSDPLKQCCNIILVHQALTLGLGTLACCTGVTLLAPSLTILLGVASMLLLILV